MTPTTLAEALFDALVETWPDYLRKAPPEHMEQAIKGAHRTVAELAAALLALPPDRRAAIAAELLDVETLAPHPNEQHEFRTTCLRCGERGALHISLIGPDEVVTIAPKGT